MATSAVSSSTSAANTSTNTASATKEASQLDRDAFLKLLIAQLQNQDPMQPLEDKEFISQLAQFSSLEQMQAMGQGFESLSESFNSLSESFDTGLTAFTANQATAQACAMIGHKIQYLDAKTEKTVEGVVDSVGVAGGVAKLNIGDIQVDLGSVLTVY